LIGLTRKLAHGNLLQRDNECVAFIRDPKIPKRLGVSR